MKKVQIDAIEPKKMIKWHFYTYYFLQFIIS